MTRQLRLTQSKGHERVPLNTHRKHVDGWAIDDPVQSRGQPGLGNQRIGTRQCRRSRQVLELSRKGFSQPLACLILIDLLDRRFCASKAFIGTPGEHGFRRT